MAPRVARNPSKRVGDPPLDIDPCPFHGAPLAPPPTAQPHPARELCPQRVLLDAGPFSAAHVVPGLGFAELLLELDEASLVRSPRLSIERLTRVATVDGPAIRPRKMEQCSVAATARRAGQLRPL